MPSSRNKVVTIIEVLNPTDTGSTIARAQELSNETLKSDHEIAGPLGRD